MQAGMQILICQKCFSQTFDWYPVTHIILKINNLSKKNAHRKQNYIFYKRQTSESFQCKNQRKHELKKHENKLA